MKIINIKTGVVFDLPKNDVEALLTASPDLFAKISKNKKIIKTQKQVYDEDSILNQILDE